MTKYTLDNYLIWNRLHVGVLIIGWFSTIASVFSILYLIGMIILYAEMSVRFRESNPHNYITSATTTSYTPYILLVVNLIKVVPDIFLIIGVEKRNGKYFIPWLIIMMIETVLAVIIYGYLLPLSFSIAYFMTLSLFFFGYHWLVVFSLRVKYMNQDQNNLNHVSLHKRMEV